VDDTVDWSEISGLVGTGSSQVAAGDHGHPWGDLSDVPAGLDDGDDDTTYSAGTGLGLSSGTFAVETPYRLPQTCSNGQIAEWVDPTMADPGYWRCTDDDVDDTVDWSEISGLVGTGSNEVAAGDHSHSWGDIQNIPADIADGDDYLHHTDVAATGANSNAATVITIGSDGLPLVVYKEDGGWGNGSINVLHCDTNDCASSEVNTISTGFVDRPDVIIGADGLPFVLFTTGTWDRKLRMFHCDDMTCSSGTMTTIAETTDIHDYRKLAVTIGPDGYPLVAFNAEHAIHYFDLTLLSCENYACTDYTSQPTVETYQVNETEVSVGIDGLPFIAYSDGIFNGMTWFVHCDTADCSAYTHDSLLSGTGWETRLRDMVIGSDGLPILITNDIAVHCDDPACSSYTYDTLHSVRSFASIAIEPEGLPIVLFDTGSDPRDLAVAHCNDVACSSAVVNILTEDASDLKDSSVTIGSDGLPIVSYYDGEIHVAHCSNVACWQRSQIGPMMNGVEYPPYFTRR